MDDRLEGEGGPKDPTLEEELEMTSEAVGMLGEDVIEGNDMILTAAGKDIADSVEGVELSSLMVGLVIPMTGLLVEERVDDGLDVFASNVVILPPEDWVEEATPVVVRLLSRKRENSCNLLEPPQASSGLSAQDRLHSLSALGAMLPARVSPH